jgi:hypothetical protein
VSTLHITNGDSAGGTLREFLRDPVAVTSDPLWDGPARAVDGEAWRRMRATHLTSPYDRDAAEIYDWLASADEAIDSAGTFDEVVLWFEHDLFDQLLLIRTLTMLARGATAPPARATMICIGEFPGIERFIGLGQLTAAQLASLVPARRPLTRAHYEQAAAAWDAFRAAGPEPLLALEPSNELPFLAAAIRRLLEEYPSTTNGLSRSEDAALRALASAPLTGGALFSAMQRAEERPFMGDTNFWGILRALASARVPLVRIHDDTRGSDLKGRTIELTEAGREVAARTRDAVDLNGIDQWRGGVHLAGDRRSPWRWDPHAETLVS